MTEATRIKLGKQWHDLIKAGKEVHDITLDHPYIQEYLSSIKEESKPKKKKVK